MKRILSRRAFLQGSAAAAGSVLVSKTVLLEAQPLRRAVAASDRVRFGMIGIGMQGSGLLTGAITIPGVECVGAADLYDGRHTLAREITGNASLPTTRRYQELLDRKDIDCIVAAVPDHWHRRVVVDACNAGKDIYCEKPMSHNVADGLAMVEAAQKKQSRGANWLAAGQFRSLRQGARTLRGWSARRHRDGGTHAGTKRSDRRVGISAAARSFSGNARLGYLAQRCSEDSVQQAALRALALLEELRHRRGGRPHGAFDQRDAGHAGME